MGQRLDLIDGARQFDTASFAAPTGMNLGLDNPNRSAKLLGSLNSLLNSEGWNSSGNGHAKLTQNVFALLFVNFHDVLLNRKGKIELKRAG